MYCMFIPFYRKFSIKDDTNRIVYKALTKQQQNVLYIN